MCSQFFNMAQLDQCCAGDADWFGREDGEQLSFDAEGHRKFMVKVGSSCAEQGCEPAVCRLRVVGSPCHPCPCA